MHVGHPLFWPILIFLIVLLVPKTSIALLLLILSPFLW